MLPANRPRPVENRKRRREAKAPAPAPAGHRRAPGEPDTPEGHEHRIDELA